MTSECKIQSIDYYWFRTYGTTDVVEGGIDHVSSRQSICWGHFSSQCNLPDDVKVLQE